MKMSQPSDRTYTVLLPISILVANSVLIGYPIVLDLLIHPFNPTALDHGVQHDPEEAGKPGGCHLVDTDDMIVELIQVFSDRAPAEADAPPAEQMEHHAALHPILDCYDDGESFAMPGYDTQHPFRIYNLTLVRQHTLDANNGDAHETIEYRVHRETPMTIEDVGSPLAWASKLASVPVFDNPFEDDDENDGN